MKARPLEVSFPEEGGLIIARPDRLGDVIISTSCLAPLRNRFPKARIYFLAADSWRSLLEDHPSLDGFIPVAPGLTSRLAELRPAAIVHLQPDKHCLQAAEKAGIPVRIGYRGRWPNELLTHSILDRRAEGIQHEAAYNFDLLRFLGVEKPAQWQPRINLDERDRRSLQGKVPWALSDTPCVVLSPFAHSAKKCWPYKRFLQLAGILNGSGFRVVLTGTSEMKRSPALSCTHLNLTGLTTPSELAWLLREARLLVSNDTGAGHLAAAVGCPSVIIFGRTDPEYGPVRWRPLSKHAVVLSSSARRRFLEPTETYWRRCFAAISVERVAEAAREILDMWPAGRRAAH